MASTSNVSSNAGTSFISGLSSGIDWSSMVDQLIAVDQQSVTAVQNKQTADQSKLQAWQSFNTQLLSLKTAADAMQNPSDFSAFTSNLSTISGTSNASDLLSASTSDTASPGSYTIKVDNLAQAQQLASNPFTSNSTALGYNGDILMNGKVITVNAKDTLTNVAASINKADTGASPSGVTATVVNFGTNDSRLILTSDTTGAAGISLLNGSSANLVQQFGWKDDQATISKNPITHGAQSDLFSSPTATISSLLNLTNPQSGIVYIDGHSVSLNLGGTNAMSLTDIKNAINTANITGVTASVVSKTENGTTSYRLQIAQSSGTPTFTDADNILNTLGILDHTNNSSTGVVSGNSMTSNGSYITASTLLKNIDGYTFTPPSGSPPVYDYITLSGTDTTNQPVSAQFNITSSTTVQDLLDQINTSYGNVLAYVTSDGKIRVDDLSGNATTNLSVTLTPTIQDSGPSLSFISSNGPFGAASAMMVAGKDAKLEVEGVPVTASSNTIDNVIPGVTLNLLKADNSTTIKLNVTQDTSAIMTLINNFVTAYNAVASTISTQDSYNTTTNTTGGVLFGDNTLLNVNSDLTSALIQPVSGVNSQFSTLAQVGISVDDKGQMSVDDTTLQGYLQTNFNDVMSLFTAQGTTSSNSLTYVGDTQNSKAGSYDVNITQAATQSSGTSDNAVTVLNPLNSNDTLTIQQGSNTATIDLTSGMSMNDIINAINTELTTDSNGQTGGHYAMGITASQNSQNQLVLTSADYGSASSFTTTDANGVLWNPTPPSQQLPVKETFTGKDVKGTIGGEDATGYGQILTGNTGNANTDGLSIEYTGSSDSYPVDAGTIKLTTGVADLFDRTLTNITDPYSGYVTFKETSLQNSIKSYTTEINQMNDQLAQKKQQMLNEFTTMETAIATIQSESSWLTSQVTAATNGWQLTAATSSTSL
ncbi:MAG: flagellar filament capping protein FliD [Syntrophales bacterium]|jgi:flagellar hook-associated protein 2